jgi:ATP-binding cassette, subfamily B, bacterial HlyB/CyaB
MDSGLAALVMLARFHGIAADAQRLAHEFALGGSAADLDTLLRAARKLGLKAKRQTVRGERLLTTPLPAIAQWRDGSGFFILAAVEGDRILVQDPARERPEIWTREMFLDQWDGELLLAASRASATASLARFDFTWFIPALVKYRRVLAEVMVVSLVLNLFALLTPLFFQVVMDKVLVNRVMSTLVVITVGLLAVVLFEAVLSGLRTYILAHTTSRIDVELGARLFRHLLALPISYFEARRVGDSVARVRELENIRSFLTSQALSSVLDVAFSVVFLAVMFWYSPWLTLIVVVSLVLYVLVSVGLTPLLRQRLDKKFARGAENQAFLVESLNGIQTIKAMAVEPQTTQIWDRQLAAYVSASLKVTHVANVGQQTISLINKLVTVGVLYWGAELVIDNKLSVGQLIAFNMLSGQVAGPILRLAQLWQDFQQTGISMERLGDILNTKTETTTPRASLPPLQGAVEFSDVSFRYRPDSPEVLRSVSFAVRPGEVVGLVGASGSGKSTLAKLAQRLYVPERGKVMMDGIDITLADSAWLRSQIGVVPQDNLLFNRTIRENIALSDPGVALDAVVHAARLAGAHDFITGLAEGYDTIVGEHGASLSGGQRQRIAIARALINQPRILIFDEATSALDYESEQVIQKNMREIVSGRTVLIIAHRLSTLRDADRIIVLREGRVTEQGSHDELMSQPTSYYRHLWEIQSR